MRTFKIKKWDHGCDKSSEGVFTLSGILFLSFGGIWKTLSLCPGNLLSVVRVQWNDVADLKRRNAE